MRGETELDRPLREDVARHQAARPRARSDLFLYMIAKIAVIGPKADQDHVTQGASFTVAFEGSAGRRLIGNAATLEAR